MGVIDLSLGHPRYLCPKEAKAGGARWLMQDEEHGYPSPQGMFALRRKIVEKLVQKNLITASVDQVVITSGGTGGILVAMASILEPGDSILIPDPGFPHYRLMCDALHVKLIPYPLSEQNGYLPDLDQVEALCESHTKAILINSPGNPIGQLFPEELLVKMGEWLERLGIYCISDEVYEDLLFKGKHKSAVRFGNPERYFTVFSFSKSYGMADLRIGYVVCPLPFAEKASRYVWTTSMGVNSLAQSAALAALKTPADYHDQLVERLRQTRDRVAVLLDQSGISYPLPQAAFYFWLDVGSRVSHAIDFSEHLARTHQVMVTPGHAFGQSGHSRIRISFAEEEQVVLEGVQRIGQCYQELKKGALM